MANFTSAHFHHRAKWTPENLQRLYEMCAAGASLDDINGAFPGFGHSVLFTGARTIIAELVKQIDPQVAK
jgi:hypothetical protein